MTTKNLSRCCIYSHLPTIRQVRVLGLKQLIIESTTIMEINYWTNGKICAKVVFPRYTESVKFRSQSRERASKRKPYRGLGTR